MGTRYLIVIIKNNEVKLSQYGQFDGYPECAGKKFIKFVRETLSNKDTERYNIKKNLFNEKVDLLKEANSGTHKVYDKVFHKLGCTHGNDSEYAIPLDILFPQFSRETGVDILDIIKKLTPHDFQRFEDNGCGYKQKWHFPVMIDTTCTYIEYAYIIDLDNDRLYMLTSHDFTGPSLSTSELVEETFKPLKCWYNVSIQIAPTVKELLDYMQQIKLT